EPCYTLTANVSPSAGGEIRTLPPSNCLGGRYASGTQVTLEAIPASGYTFSHWSGDVSGSNNPRTLTMNGNRSVTAHFSQNCYTLHTAVNPSGSGSIQISPSANCPGGQYVENTQVTLTAQPAS